MKERHAPESSSRLLTLCCFIGSLVACYFVAEFWKDSVTAAYAIHRSARVVDVRIKEYLGERRQRYRKVTSLLHEYRASGDGKQWNLRLPEQLSKGAMVTITYAVADPSTFVLGRHSSFISAFTKISGGMFGFVFLGGCFAATALFGYGVYTEFFKKSG